MGSWEIPVNEEETIDVWVRDELSIWETKMKRMINDLKKYGKYVIYAGQSELKAEVANSYLNWLWWVIEPFCFMLVYAFVFGVIFDSQLQYFPIFIFIGITVWDFFNRMLKASVSSVKNSKAIVSKVYIPKYMLILVKGYVNGFKMLVSFAIVFGMILVWGVPITWKFLFIIPILLTLFVITFGVCTFLLHFGVYVDDLANVLNIFLRMMFYLGEQGIGAYAVSEYVGGLFSAVFYGVSMSIVPVVGYHLGQQNKEELHSLRRNGKR